MATKRRSSRRASRRSRGSRRRHGNAEGVLLDNMVRDLKRRKKIEVRNDSIGDFFVLMKKAPLSKYAVHPYALYAPSLDGRKPADRWLKMADHELRNWLQMLKPRLRVIH